VLFSNVPFYLHSRPRRTTRLGPVNAKFWLQPRDKINGRDKVGRDKVGRSAYPKNSLCPLFSFNQQSEWFLNGDRAPRLPPFAAAEQPRSLP